MKKFIILLVLSFLTSFIYSQNYNKGNGTILKKETENGIETTIRKCILDVTIGDLLDEEYRVIFDGYKSLNILSYLQDNDNVTVLEVITRKNLLQSKEAKRDKGEIWYKIKRGNLIGFIKVSEGYCDEYYDPYFNNKWEILETIESSGKTWTVRRLDSLVSVWVRLNVRDKPGMGGKKVYMLHDFDSKTDPDRNPQENHNIIAITEERETIDGLTDCWLKIEYEKGKFGWIFGGYANVERGGPKYNRPEEMVTFDLGWY